MQRDKDYENELNSLLENEGHVEMEVSKVLITGAAGSGKTCTKHILCKLKPPKEHTSTELLQPMDRAYAVPTIMNEKEIIHDIAYCEFTDEYDWIVVDSEGHLLYSMVATTVDSLTKEDSEDATVAVSPDDLGFESIVLDSPTSQAPPRKRFKLSQPRSLVRYHLTSMESSSKGKQQLLEKLKDPNSRGKCVDKVHWIHFIDSGGQSAFHDILPAFLHNTSVLIYVLKLSETLDEQPFDDYYEKGIRIGDPKKSPYQVEQILKGVIQSICYERDRDQDFNKAKVLIIGTHKDKETDKESSEAKNAKLQSLFDPVVDSKQLHVLSHGEYRKGDIMFRLNAKDQDDDSKFEAQCIRRRIITNCNKQKKRIPISWFLLEEDLRIIGESSECPRGILKTSECELIGKEKLNLSTESVLKALEYFHDLNIFFFFRKANIIFTKPQVLVTVLSAFVKRAYQLRKPGTPTDTEDLSYTEQGQFTKMLIQKYFADFMVPDADFKEEEMIELLQMTLVIAPINDSEYFMPCVLQHCQTKHIESDISTQCVAPIVIKLPGECIPRGFFCALVCSLLSKWKLDRKMLKMFKNYVRFDIEDMVCSVAIVDSFYFICVHVFGECGRVECKEICGDIRQAVEMVVDKHNYDKDLIMEYDKNINFLCPCGKTPEHIATLTKRGKLKLKCHMDQKLVIMDKHAVWFSDEEYSKWKQQLSQSQGIIII